MSSPLKIVVSCLLVSGVLVACAADKTSRDKLPDEMLGTWKFIQSSGGFTGAGDGNYSIEKIVLTRENVMEEHRGGKKENPRDFKVSFEKTIFAIEPQWVITLSEDSSPLVLRIIDKTLHVSANAFDGYSYQYERAK